jgi:hypothetical protein
MFFPISPKCAKRRQIAHVGAFFRHEVAFLRLLAPFYAFLRTFAVLGQAEIFRCILVVFLKIENYF